MTATLTGSETTSAELGAYGSHPKTRDVRELVLELSQREHGTSLAEVRAATRANPREGARAVVHLISAGLVDLTGDQRLIYKGRQ